MKELHYPPLAIESERMQAVSTHEKFYLHNQFDCVAGHIIWRRRQGLRALWQGDGLYIQQAVARAAL